MQNFQLKQAPAGYVPNVETTHGADCVMRQTFPGGRIVVEMDKKNGGAVVTIDGREVARFKDPTISDWGNILYTLESDYTEFINQNKIQSDESIN
jgi:hypothetical protein